MLDYCKKLYFDPQSGTFTAIPQTTVNDVKQFTFAHGSNQWYIEHNYNTSNVVVQIFDNNYELIMPNDIIITVNDITITFDQPVDGFVNVLFVSADIHNIRIVTPTPTISVTPTPTVTPTITPTVTPAVTPTATAAMLP